MFSFLRNGEHEEEREQPVHTNGGADCSTHSFHLSSVQPCHWRFQSRFPEGASSLLDSDQDHYITQLVHRLESLHMSAVLTSQQVSLDDCLSNAHSSQESTICSSQNKSSKVLKQHHRIPLKMPVQRLKLIGVYSSIHWESQEHKTVEETQPKLEIHQIKVSNVTPTRKKIPDEYKTIYNYNKTLQSPNEQHLESENSDLSDQERECVLVLKQQTPVEMDLTPDLSGGDLEQTETDDGGQEYLDVLPFTIKDLDIDQLSDQKCLSDPCLAALAARMMNMKKLEALTIQKEQAKRSRPATAVEVTGNHPRQVVIFDDVTKQTFSSNTQMKSVQRNHISLKSRTVWTGFQQPPATPKKPQSAVVRVKKTKALVQNVADGSTSPKCNTTNSSKKYKHIKKLKAQNTSSEKTVSNTSFCRKT